jgi:hypothetical protein
MQPFRNDDFQAIFKELQDTRQYRALSQDPLVPDPGICEDLNSRCKEWAASGECKKNPIYMGGVGSNGPGQCRKACGICEDCRRGDRECYKRNREAAGYLDLSHEVMQLTGKAMNKLP